MEKTIESIIKRKDVAAYMVPKSPAKLAEDLKSGKVILFGATNDPGNSSAEGFLRDWYIDELLTEVRRLIGIDIKIYVMKHRNNRDFIFVGLEDSANLNEVILLCGENQMY